MSTPRKLLKRALGRHHAALDDIPLHKFEFKAHKHCWSGEYESTALHYGQMLYDQNVSHEIWVHLRKSGRAGEIHYIGINPVDGSPVQFKAIDVAERAHVRDEFQPISGKAHEIPAFLRACILLHGGKISRENCNYTKSFLDFLRRACSRYKEDASNQTSSSHAPAGRKVANGYESSPEVPLVLELPMHKGMSLPNSKQSEQRGPYDPRFDALHPWSSPTPTGSQAQAQLHSPSKDNGYFNNNRVPDFERRRPLHTSSHPNATAGNREASGASIGGAPIAPRAMRIWSKELNNATARQVSDHEVRVNREEIVNAINSVPMPLPSTPARTPAVQKRDESGGSHMADRSSSSGAVDMLHALNNRMETVQAGIDRCKQSITEANTVWMQRRESKRKEIDEDLCQKHKEQHSVLKEEHARQEVELRAHQRQEYLELKDQYNKMKEDQQLDVTALQQQENKKRLELQALQQDFEYQRQLLAKDPNKLIDVLLAQGGTNNKRKRGDSADGGWESHDQDVKMSG